MKIDKWIKKNNLNFSGKVVVITGTTNGIGHQAFLHLVSLGATIVCGVRNVELAKLQKDEVLKKYPSAKIYIHKIDLLDLSTIKSFAQSVDNDFSEGIYALINNAGIYAQKRELLNNKVEKHFWLNTIAPIILTKLLEPALNKQKDSKVVFVNSISHKFTKIDPQDVFFDKKKSKTKLYANTKRWQLIYLTHYKQLLEKRGITVNVCHPGVCSSSLMNPKNGGMKKWLYSVINVGMKIVFMSTKKASLNEVYSLFVNTKNGEWVVPKYFGIYGYPKIKKTNLKQDPKITDFVVKTIDDFANQAIKNS